jgi:hypothetical protein
MAPEFGLLVRAALNIQLVIAKITVFVSTFTKNIQVTLPLQLQGQPQEIE